MPQDSSAHLMLKRTFKNEYIMKSDIKFNYEIYHIHILLYLHGIYKIIHGINYHIINKHSLNCTILMLYIHISSIFVFPLTFTVCSTKKIQNEHKHLLNDILHIDSGKCVVTDNETMVTFINLRFNNKCMSPSCGYTLLVLSPWFTLKREL